MMETILIQTDNEGEMNLIIGFLKKHKLKSRILSEDDKEGIVLGRLMEETDYTDTVDTNDFLRQLRG